MGHTTKDQLLERRHGVNVAPLPTPVYSNKCLGRVEAQNFPAEFLEAQCKHRAILSTRNNRHTIARVSTYPQRPKWSTLTYPLLSVHLAHG